MLPWQQDIMLPWQYSLGFIEFGSKNNSSNNYLLITGYTFLRLLWQQTHTASQPFYNNIRGHFLFKERVPK